MGKLQDGTTPWIDFEVGAAPSTPAAGIVRVYAKTGDSMAQKDDAGAETLLDGAGGGGSGLYSDYLCYRDEKAQGTNGGTFTSGAWRTRDLNTEHADTGGLGSVGSNQITLAAGTYRVHATAPAHNVNQNQLRLYNVTDTAVLVLGTSQYCSASSDGEVLANLQGRFTIGGTKTIELQHQCATTKSSDGFGVPTNLNTEVFAVVELWKEA